MSKQSKGFILTALIFSMVFASFAGIQTSSASALLSPAQTVATALDALKLSDTETFNRYIQQTADPASRPVKSALLESFPDRTGREFVDAVMNGFTYEIIAESFQGDTAVVTVALTNHDLSNVLMYMILESVQDAGMSEDSHLNLMISRAAEKGTLRTNEASFTLQLVNGAWTVILDGTAMNAICGNLFGSAASAL